MTRVRTGVHCGLLGLFVGLWAASPAYPEGAFAVGSTGNVVKDGIAYGGSYNHPNREDAEAGALRACRRYEAARRAAALCRIVATFSGECYAVANDPKAGTPGTGWAIARDEDTARERALAACQASAGVGREAYCTVEQSHCDEN